MFLLASILSEVRISDQILVSLQNIQLRITPMGLKHGSNHAGAIFN